MRRRPVADRHGQPHESRSLREGDTLARLGGDEFVAVLLDLTDVAASVPMLTRLLAAAAQPVPVGDLVLQVSASLGVTFYLPAEELDADQLLRQADQAMYQAKLAGKNRYHVFDAEQDRSVRGHHESLERIRRALADREFVLHYQPKVNMRTGDGDRRRGADPLATPGTGPAAAGGLPAGDRRPSAGRRDRRMGDRYRADPDGALACGRTGPAGQRQCRRAPVAAADFVERLRDILLAHPDVRPGDLELEVLETSALEDLAHVSQVIEACREIGVSLPWMTLAPAIRR